MGGCTGCFNSCTEIISDKCVRYTGNDIVFLGITNGMPLAEVEEQITDYLATVLAGAGIIPTLPDTICSLVSDYLPESGDITLIHVISALISSACDLQEQVTTNTTDIATIEADYTVSCLSGVTASSGTHDILQAVITKLCSVSDTVTALQNALTSYVKISEVDTYIANYLATNVPSSKMYNNMVPYAAVEYYGDLTGKFDATGAGIGDWEQVYLCNGLNGTPDKRGRIAVGANSMGSNSYSSSATNPAVSGNPDYDLLDEAGSNKVTLGTSNLPAHTHTTVITLAESPHYHYTFNNDSVSYSANVLSSNYPAWQSTYGTDRNYDIMGTGTIPTLGRTSSVSTGISVSGVTVSNTGENIAHENRPPVLACYYIMYIPD